jgi:hypothetical protein
MSVRICRVAHWECQLADDPGICSSTGSHAALAVGLRFVLRHVGPLSDVEPCGSLPDVALWGLSMDGIVRAYCNAFLK